MLCEHLNYKQPMLYDHLNYNQPMSFLNHPCFSIQVNFYIILFVSWLKLHITCTGLENNPYHICGPFLNLFLNNYRLIESGEEEVQRDSGEFWENFPLEGISSGRRTWISQKYWNLDLQYRNF